MSDTHVLLSPLNQAQQRAVSAPPGHLLVLAGAGSGKTRVLVHRIAWLLQTEHLHTHNILAVTFTNKAATEMRGRIEALLGFSVQSMWVGTFHSLAHRLLRLHWQEAGLPQDFQILDADDQQRLVKRVIQLLQLDEDRWPARQATHFINNKKEAGQRPDKLQAFDPHTKTMIRIYEAYQLLCQQSGLVDFSELLLRALELWLKNPDIVQHYRTRFRHVLVDEFQDTNAIQYAWICQLLGPDNPVTIVGDDDQSIYGWRGAKVENIQRFSQDFPQSTLIRLEQNYRSTGTILAAANALISHNDQRLGKNLWTEGEAGERITTYAAFNELDEAHFIVAQIKRWTLTHPCRKDIAILYRSNAQSRLLEEALIQAKVPYRIYGGLRFFERAEIKDALAYLRLLVNRNHDAAFERVINVPTRGIGEQTLSQLRDYAKTQKISLWQAMCALLEAKSLPSRTLQALSRFHTLIEELTLPLDSLALHEITEQVLQQTGLNDHYQKEKGEKGQARRENLAELINAARQFSFSSHESQPNLSTTPLLSEFLANAALEAGEYQAEKFDDYVQLMTLHAAKGLEFPLVFICGVEEGLFPHPMSLEEEGRLEEERRLCYVGMTRAMRKLFLTYAEIRRLYGQEHYHKPSRFIREIPSDLLDEVRINKSTTSAHSAYRSYSIMPPKKMPTANTARPSFEGFSVGQQVTHPKFGEGIILNYEGQGEQTRVQIRFKREGVKWLALAYAKLT
ncbi:MAG: DNA helicase II [Gammaproteobacteria bacterium]|nr:DNA helicase II [Gammaproteobacteria bacterium]